MSKIKITRKLTAVVLALAMILSLPIGAFATGSYSIPQEDLGSTDVESLTITEADVTSCELTTTEFTDFGYTNYRYTYDIVLSAQTAPRSVVTATFTISDSADEDCFISHLPPTANPQAIFSARSLIYKAVLSGGVGTVTAYDHHDLADQRGRCDIYTFNYTLSSRANPITDATTQLTLRFGDIAYPSTEPECYMTFEDATGGYNAVYDNEGSTFYPGILAFYITNGADTITSMASINAANVAFREYDGQGGYVDLASPSPGSLQDGFYVIKIFHAGGITITTGSGSTNIYFSDPSEQSAPAGAHPDSVVSYLPIGQYATGTGWGSAAGKFISGTGFESLMGVSLGSLGGYIEFEFDGGIADDPENPYGVDFVVYGNAFDGNPEAGAVQVSEDGGTWYELAGSLYYDGGFNFVGNQGSAGKFSKAYTGTLRDAGVIYTLTGGGITADLSGADGSGAANPFTTATAWWPKTTEYPEFISGGVIKPHGDADVDSNVTIDYTGDTTGSALSFGGVTAVFDSDTNVSYAFGYADVTPNGSPTTYGAVVNPYPVYTSGKTGGDGFDLEWAVDVETGEPVDVSGLTFHYVRVYSAVLDNGTFNETSPEVCGIFTTANPEAADVGRTTAPSITVDGYDIEEWYPDVSTVGNVVVYDIGGLDSGMVIGAEGAVGSNVYVNSSSAGSYTTNAQTEFVRVIVQSGDAAPYIVIIK